MVHDIVGWREVGRAFVGLLEACFRRSDLVLSFNISAQLLSKHHLPRIEEQPHSRCTNNLTSRRYENYHYTEMIQIAIQGCNSQFSR